MSTKYKSVQLTEVLQFLEGEENNTKPFLFVNPTTTLETFFTYKANMKELHKMKLLLEMHPGKKNEIESELRGCLESGMKIGSWVVFNLGSSPTFNLTSFLKQFPFYHKDMFQPVSIHNKDFCLQHNILREESNVDFYGNHGYFEIKETFKFCFLSTCKESEIDKLISSNPELEFDVIIAQ